ncbi:MAG: ribonuclease H-like domain-containing protein [Chitinophagales bacterium]|nr:ribonuclease H-like domain-containing protein [Chitinophagales bacterium]HNC65223.1 ribonuclease H-like domain-containing protein [Chitinophagales bacterium]HNL17558.1 ribonuclease H-like domain-containing protein [Chitinophagales bacterium]
MLQQSNISDLIFIDIETTPAYENLQKVPEYEQLLWEEKRGRYRLETENIEDFYFNNAGIYAEFGKIICISVGLVTKNNNALEYNKISFYGDDESVILKDFYLFLDKSFKQNSKINFCGHNIKEFDIPYICRRSLIKGFKLHPFLAQLQTKKPWENGSIDTMELWKFGDYKNYISLKLLAYSLGIPSPKDDISGKDVGRVYWQEKDLERIKTYCEKDVLTTAQIILKLKGMDLLSV